MTMSTSRNTSSTAPARCQLGFNGEYLEHHQVQILGSYRAYNPVLMRFHGPDSLSPFSKGGLNAYAYCHGDPVNRVDPTGHFMITPGTIWLAMGVSVVGLAGGVLSSMTAAEEDDGLEKSLHIGAAVLSFALGIAAIGFAGFAAQYVNFTRSRAGSISSTSSSTSWNIPLSNYGSQPGNPLPGSAPSPNGAPPGYFPPYRNTPQTQSPGPGTIPPAYSAQPRSGETVVEPTGSNLAYPRTSALANGIPSAPRTPLSIRNTSVPPSPTAGR